MKKSICAIIAASLCLFTMPVFAGEAKFTRSTGSSNLHMYNFSDYQVGNYRSNFVSIPQNRMLNYLDGFRGKVGVFELDGNILYVGLDENAAIQLCDSNMNFYVTAKSYKTRLKIPAPKSTSPLPKIKTSFLIGQKLKIL